MHYYQFNIGDYASHTRQLTPLEDIAYRRMIDLYYLNEQPLNGCSTSVARDIGMREHVDEVDYVLSKYFEPTGDSWTHKRIDSDISAFNAKIKSRSKAGKASAKSRKVKDKSSQVEQVNNKCSTSVQLTTNHKPLTNNHKPLKNTDDANASSAKDDLPKTINVEAWNDWIAFRKRAGFRKYKTMRPAIALAKLSQQQQRECVDFSIGNEYQGLFPDRFAKQKTIAAKRDFSGTDYGEMRGSI